MGECELFLFMLKIILLRHKVGLCLHGHICVCMSEASSVCYVCSANSVHCGVQTSYTQLRHGCCVTCIYSPLLCGCYIYSSSLYKQQEAGSYS